MAKSAMVRFTLPDDLAARLGPPEKLNAVAKEAFLMGLVSDGAISQGKAAELLGITRWEVLDLMVRYKVPSGPLTPEELEHELAAARLQAAEHRDV